jgi:exodeoxyribonuclease-3
VKIATWNVNSIKARLPNAFEWLDQAKPDVVLLQEIKCQAEDFPRLEFEAHGYHLAVRGQKTYNGVAVLSRRPIVEEVRSLPGDPERGEARYLEAVLDNGLRVISVYVPMGQSVDSDRFPFKLEVLDGLAARARQLLAAEIPFVMAGDYNVCPEPLDLYDPAGWEGGVHFHIEERRRIRGLLHLGLTDAFRALHPDEAGYSYWDYRAGAWQRDLGLRIDYLLLAPRLADRLGAAGVDRWCRGKEKCSDHVPVWCEIDWPSAGRGQD